MTSKLGIAVAADLGSESAPVAPEDQLTVRHVPSLIVRHVPSLIANASGERAA